MMQSSLKKMPRRRKLPRILTSILSGGPLLGSLHRRVYRGSFIVIGSASADVIYMQHRPITTASITEKRIGTSTQFQLQDVSKSSYSTAATNSSRTSATFSCIPTKTFPSGKCEGRYSTAKPLFSPKVLLSNFQQKKVASSLLKSSLSTKRRLQIRTAQTGRSLSTFSSSLLQQHDRLLVIGSGVAGCSTALIAAERHNIPVTLLFAGSTPLDCNSYWAQGGIIYRNYRPNSNDSAESLVADVQRAGAGLCLDEAVWKVATEGPDRVRELLLDDGSNGGTSEAEERRRRFANVPFDRDEDGELSCCLEASHAAPRIIHFADCTGKAITEHITAAAASHPLITVIPNTIVTDLLVHSPSQSPISKEKNEVCIGAQTLNKVTNELNTLYASYGTVIACGGLGGIYEHTTNPPGFNALGSSVALALRANATVCDLEYVQFHPTSLYIPNQPRFLLTEALRGEGAILRDASGRAFAQDYHPDGELAPRDIVARAVFTESQKATGEVKRHNAYLDITHRDATFLRKRFPSVDAHLRENAGIDMTKAWLPVIPAAHYACGGVQTDLFGRTSLLGLYAAGESARTGLHGGNRLASTSLLEGLVFGASVADFVGGGGAAMGTTGKEINDLAREAIEAEVESVLPSSSSLLRLEGSKGVLHQSEQVPTRDANKTKKVMDANELLKCVKKTMWNNVGVVRTPAGLAAATESLASLRQEVTELFRSFPCTETAAVRDAAYAGEAVAIAALENPVSAGAHCIIMKEMRPEYDIDHDSVVEIERIPRQEENFQGGVSDSDDTDSDKEDDSDSDDEAVAVAER